MEEGEWRRDLNESLNDRDGVCGDGGVEEGLSSLTYFSKRLLKNIQSVSLPLLSYLSPAAQRGLQIF